MSTVSVSTSGLAGRRAMAAIEARRLARHPVFLVGVALAFGVLALMVLGTEDPVLVDVLSIPVVPAFFIGLPSMVVTARLTRSTEGALEAVGTAPGTEAGRTVALLGACVVPFLAGLAFVVALVGAAAALDVAPQEWWLGTMPHWQVWSILLALGPVACLGGAVLGVLVGRWLRFPGAAAAVAVVLVVGCMVGQLPLLFSERSELRLWVPWASFHSGSKSDGTQEIIAGNPLAYLGYLLCLCAAAALVAVWHDRTARTSRLRAGLGAVVLLGAVCLALAVTTGASDNRVSDPVPFQVEG